MKNIALFLALGLMTSCGLFAKKTVVTPSVIAAPLPAWNGEYILCSEDVSFDPAATDTLPTFPADERLGLCERTVQYLELHRQHGAQTEFFGIAAATSASLAATYAPLVQRAYSAETWAFMGALNSKNQQIVLEIAQEFRAGSRPSIESLIARDQQFTQAMLDQLALDNPAQFETVVAEVGNTLNPTNRFLLAAINRSPFFGAYEAGLAQVRSQIAGPIDFGNLENRLLSAEILRRLMAGI